MATLKNFIVHARPPRWQCRLRINITSDFKILEKFLSGNLAEPKGLAILLILRPRSTRTGTSMRALTEGKGQATGR